MLRDRKHAAQLLAERLSEYKNSDTVIVAIPKGGVPVGFHLSQLLDLELEIIPCCKLRHPANPTEVVGSITPGAAELPNENLDIPQSYVSHQIAMLKRAAQAQYEYYHDGRKAVSQAGRVVILVDDHLQNENQVIALIRSIRQQNPKKIVVAIPVVTAKAVQRIVAEGVEFINLFTIKRTDATSALYEFFPPVSDEEVKELFQAAAISFESRTADTNTA